MLIDINGITVTSATHISFSDPQVEIGPTPTAYEQTIGFDSGFTQPGTGPILWPQLFQMLPEQESGTLAPGQTPVTLTTSPAEVLTTVASNLPFNFGCTDNGCEPFPGSSRSTYLQELWGLARVECTGVTAAGTVTASIVTKSVASNEGWSTMPGSGVAALQNVPVNAGTSYIYLPVQVANAGWPPNSDFGAFDIEVEVSAAVSPSGACEVTAAQLNASLIPNDSSVASEMNPLGYGDRSRLVH